MTHKKPHYHLYLIWQSILSGFRPAHPLLYNPANCNLLKELAMFVLAVITLLSLNLFCLARFARTSKDLSLCSRLRFNDNLIDLLEDRRYPLTHISDITNPTVRAVRMSQQISSSHRMWMSQIFFRRMYVCCLEPEPFFFSRPLSPVFFPETRWTLPLILFRRKIRSQLL